MRTYYTLEVKYPEDNDHWYPEFGDYDHEVVKQEREDMLQSGDIKAARITKSQVSEEQYLAETQE